MPRRHVLLSAENLKSFIQCPPVKKLVRAGWIFCFFVYLSEYRLPANVYFLYVIIWELRGRLLINLKKSETLQVLNYF
jgi:hypothetical protein